MRFHKVDKIQLFFGVCLEKQVTHGKHAIQDDLQIFLVAISLTNVFSCPYFADFEDQSREEGHRFICGS